MIDSNGKLLDIGSNFSRVSDLKSLSHIKIFRQEITKEIYTTNKYQEAAKDILIVVHNQLFYVKKCLESIWANTKNYNLYIWDNASDEETQAWLQARKNEGKITALQRSEENLGFIEPNNSLAKNFAKSPYIILLNSDTIVSVGWDEAMIAQIQVHGFAQVGYSGGYLDAECKGSSFGYGSQIDYIPGWCFCIPLEIYQSFGLFDQEHLTFAYGEDSDLSLRLQEAGRSIYALHVQLVYHYQNKTIAEVAKIRNCRKSFEDNHLYLKDRWSKRLKNGV